MARHSKRASSALALCNGNFVDVAVARQKTQASFALALQNVNFVDVAVARQKTQASFALALQNVAPSGRREICSPMSIIKFINHI